MMIRQAKLSETPYILDVAKACKEDMIHKGIFQWNDHYPTKQIFENDIRQNELFVLEDNAVILGTIVISSLMDEEYAPVKWVVPNGKSIYIHRLAVHPSQQGKGYAQQLMAFAEDYAKTHGFVSIRLDTFSKNLRNQKFYEARGYQRLESIYFPKQSEHPFYCYELVL